MPTDLPPRRIAPPLIELTKSTREGNLAFAVAVVVMLLISVVLLWLHPADAAAITARMPLGVR